MTKSILTTLFTIASLMVSAQQIKPFQDANHLWGFKDENEKILIPVKYYNVIKKNSKYGNFYKVSFNGREGLVNSKGIEIAEPKYFSLGEFYEGFAIARMGNNNYGFIDTTGKESIPLIYRDVFDFKNGIAIVVKEDKKGNAVKGAIDKTGKIIVPIKYDELYGFDRDGLCMFNLGKKKGFINKNGEEVLAFSKYDRIGYFNFNRASVQNGEKWGYIDKTGKEIIPVKYDMAEDFDDAGLGKVKIKEKYILIDTMGNLANGSAGFNVSAKVNIARDKWVVVTTKELKASEPVYFLTAEKYGKNPAPFAAAITWQILDNKGNVIKEQRTQAGESCGFKVPSDGSYTVQVYYDMRDCVGCRSEDKPSAFTMGYSFNTKL